MKTLNDYKEEYNKLYKKKNLKGKEALEVVKQDGYDLRYVKEQTEEICLEAVKQNGYALQFVKEQTEKICLEAVKQNGYALRYVAEQTEKICLEAVKQDGYTLQCVREQTEEICLEAVKQNSYALQYVSEDMFTKEENKENSEGFTIYIDRTIGQSIGVEQTLTPQSEKKIKKLEWNTISLNRDLANKIDEIIDHLNNQNK